MAEHGRGKGMKTLFHTTSPHSQMTQSCVVTIITIYWLFQALLKCGYHHLERPHDTSHAKLQTTSALSKGISSFLSAIANCCFLLLPLLFLKFGGLNTLLPWTNLVGDTFIHVQLAALGKSSQIFFTERKCQNPFLKAVF